MIDQGANGRDGVTDFSWAAMHDANYLYIMVFGEKVVGNTLQADSSNPWNDDTVNVYINGDNSPGDNYDGINDFQILIPHLKMLTPTDTTIGNPIVADASGNPGNNPNVVFDENGNLILNDAGEMLVRRADSTQVFVPVDSLEANNSEDTFAMGGRAFWGANSAIPPEQTLTFANCLCSNDQHVYEIRFKFSDLGIERQQMFGIEVQIDDDIDGQDRDARYGWHHPSRTDGDVDTTWTNPSVMGTAWLR